MTTAPPVPLAAGPDVTQLLRLEPLVRDRAVVVVGSAPLTTPTAVIAPDELALPVNGGISSVDGVPAVWFLNSKPDKPRWQQGIRDLHARMLRQGTDRTVGHVVLLRSPKVATEQDTLAHLASMQCTVGSWSVLDKPTKRWLEEGLCGRLPGAKGDKAWCSAGLLAVVVALWCGAARVRLTGFSWTGGYHYLPGQAVDCRPRHEVSADRKALCLLTAAYPDRLCGDLVDTCEAVPA